MQTKETLKICATCIYFPKLNSHTAFCSESKSHVKCFSSCESHTTIPKKIKKNITIKEKKQ